MEGTGCKSLGRRACTRIFLGKKVCAYMNEYACPCMHICRSVCVYIFIHTIYVSAIINAHTVRRSKMAFRLKERGPCRSLSGAVVPPDRLCVGSSLVDVTKTEFVFPRL